MTYCDHTNYSGKFQLPNPEIDTFALSLCRSEEQAFIHGCNYLLLGQEDRSYREFRRAVRIDREFYDAWFMMGFIDLLNGRVDQGRQSFLKIIRTGEPFFGIYILRFLPKLRLQLNLFEDFCFHCMPTTPEIAAFLARLYVIEKRPREAKKIIHPAFREFPENLPVRVMWAQSMIADGSSDEVIEEIDRKLNYHQGKTELDLLVTFLIGEAYLDKADFRTAVAHWEGLLHHATGKNPRLIDRFRIHLARAYESKGFLMDVLEILKLVEDRGMEYMEGQTVDNKLGEVVERINTFKRQGIKRPLEYSEAHMFPRWQKAEGFLELDGPEPSFG